MPKIISFCKDGKRIDIAQEEFRAKVEKLEKGGIGSGRYPKGSGGDKGEYRQDLGGRVGGKYNIGEKVKVVVGSGLASDKEAIVVDKSSVKIDGRGVPTNIEGAYKPVDWKAEVAIQYEDGKIDTMFRNRLIHLNDTEKMTKGGPGSGRYPKGSGKDTEITDKMPGKAGDNGKPEVHLNIPDPIKSIKEYETDVPKETLKQSDLDQFTGSENYYKSMTGMKFTDGVKYLADKAGAYWLVDEISFNMKEAKFQKPELQEFTVWKITTENQKGTLTAEDGNGNKVFSKKINYTDFPLKEASLWYENGVLILPSEH